MIIVSDFHDYYDCIQKTGGYEDLRYFRKKQTLIIDYDLPTAYNGNFYTRVVGLCGKLYPLFFLAKDDEGRWEERLVTSIEDVDYWADIIYSKKQKQCYYNSKNWFWRGFSVSSRKHFISLLKEQTEIKLRPPQLLLDIFKDYSVPIFVIRRHSHQKVSIILNEQLKQYDFQKIVDPYTAFQEVQMFLSNVALPEKPIPEIDDVTLAQAKGFDKFSFRKDKSK